jgi:hypothetical protein
MKHGVSIANIASRYILENLAAVCELQTRRTIISSIIKKYYRINLESEDSSTIKLKNYSLFLVTAVMNMGNLLF